MWLSLTHIILILGAMVPFMLRKPVRPSIEKFERLLIRPNDFQNRVRLAYLWSKGDTESSRGMGKTALLRYFQQRINQDWGWTEFDGQFLCAGGLRVFPFPSRPAIHGAVGLVGIG